MEDVKGLMVEDDQILDYKETIWLLNNKKEVQEEEVLAEVEALIVVGEEGEKTRTPNIQVL